jgi:hypothetical protein
MADGKTLPSLAKMLQQTGGPLPVQAGLRRAYTWETQPTFKDQLPSFARFWVSEMLIRQTLRGATAIFSPLLVMIKAGPVMLQVGARLIRPA